MRKGNAIAILIVMFAITAAAGSKIEGTTTLKDFQPFGTDRQEDAQASAVRSFFRGNG